MMPAVYAARLRAAADMPEGVVLYRPGALTPDGAGSQIIGNATPTFVPCRVSFGVDRARFGGRQGETVFGDNLVMRELWSVRVPFGTDVRHTDVARVMSRIWAPLTSYAKDSYAFARPFTGELFIATTSGVSGEAPPAWNLIDPVLDGTVVWTRAKWIAAKSRAVGEYVTPPTPNGLVYRCTVGGTSTGTQPTWPTRGGRSVIDGGVTWTEATDELTKQLLDIFVIITGSTLDTHMVVVGAERK